MRRAIAVNLCRQILLALGIVAGFSCAPLARAVPEVTLWVVQPPGELVAFEPSDFSRIGGVRIPPAAFDDPSQLAVNGHGQFLVRLDDQHLWLWDGAKARTLPVVPASERASSAFHAVGGTPTRQWLLGDDGTSLFVVEGVARAPDDAGSDTCETPLRMSQTDLSQRLRQDVFARTVRPCRKHMFLAAETEPCPDPSVWVPDGVVRSCAVLTHWEQMGGLPEESPPDASCVRTLYISTAGGWRASELTQLQSEEPLLDISSDGSAWVQPESDGGCCGWSNDSSDQTVFGDADTTEIVFDEWSTFHNQDYDVSFYTDEARIAPDARHIAFTVRATEGAAAEIRLSAEGHADSLELNSIRASLAELPLVMVVRTRPRSAEVLRLPHVELVGWAGDSEVVVVDDGYLATVNMYTGQRRRSDIPVRSAADALIVWR
jgi:hypothetical protein